jgi:hypothetical protein
MIETVLQILKRRSYIFTCSYETAWKNWMTNDEKAGVTFEEIIPVLNK